MGRRKDKPADTRRVPFVLNLNDEVDAAIWAKLEPLLDLHRASAYIRAVLAKEILGQSVEPMITISPSSNGHKPALSASNGQHDFPRAKRPAALPAHAESFEENSDLNDILDDIENATDNFLGMFG